MEKWFPKGQPGQSLNLSGNPQLMQTAAMFTEAPRGSRPPVSLPPDSQAIIVECTVQGAYGAPERESGAQPSARTSEPRALGTSVALLPMFLTPPCRILLSPRVEKHQPNNIQNTNMASGPITSTGNRRENKWKQWQILALWAPNLTVDGDCNHRELKDTLSEENL